MVAAMPEKVLEGIVAKVPQKRLEDQKKLQMVLCSYVKMETILLVNN